MTSGILQSQVITLLHKLSETYKNDIAITLMTTERPKDFFNYNLRKSFQNNFKKFGIHTVIVPKFMPEQLHYSSRTKGIIYKMFKAQNRNIIKKIF